MYDFEQERILFYDCFLKFSYGFCSSTKLINFVFVGIIFASGTAISLIILPRVPTCLGNFLNLPETKNNHESFWKTKSNEKILRKIVVFVNIHEKNLIRHFLFHSCKAVCVSYQNKYLMKSEIIRDIYEDKRKLLESRGIECGQC